MNKQQVLDELRSLGDVKVALRNKGNGAHDNQFGVKLGDLRTVARKLKSNQSLARELWYSGNIDAQLLSTLLFKPAAIQPDELKSMAKEINFVQVAEWFYAYILKDHATKEPLRRLWMHAKDPFLARLGWQLTSGMVVREPDMLDLGALLDRIEQEMPDAPSLVQWTMNFTLGYIGIHHPVFRERVLAMGERLGMYRDYPVAKGCTSPFVPIWVNEMIRRQS